MAEEKSVSPIHDNDMDSLFALPLSIIPLTTPGLAHARLIKNVRLQSVIELYQTEGLGSAQMEIEALPKAFGWELDANAAHPDLIVLRKLALLHSYDVYSLRILLREHGISVNELNALKLSPDKAKELSSTMAQFTRPLIQQIYGDSNVQIKEFDDLISLFRDPDIKKARENLQVMAEKLKIDLAELPKFLQDYGDIFLSLSYYRHSLDRLAPLITSFIESMYDIRSNWQLRHDYHLIQTCAMIETTVNNLSANITGRFENFDRSSKDMWSNLTAERFRHVKKLIESYHTTIGGVLCALTVKMNAWVTLFPKRSSGGPVKRAEFIMSEMKQGIDRIQAIEDSVPMLSGSGW